MSFSFVSGRTKSARGLASRFALALALAGGAVIGSAAAAPAAYAQDNSRGFANAYSPVAELVTGDMPNWQAASAQFETLVAAIENEDDRNIAGNFALQIGVNTNDQLMQRRGLEMMLASGKVPPETVGLYNFYVGNFALRAGEMAAASAALQIALDSGYLPPEAATDVSTHPRSQLLQIMLRQDQGAEAARQVQALAAAAKAGGAAVPVQWIRLGLQGALDAEDTPAAMALTVELVKNEPTAENWNLAGRVVLQSTELDDGAQLDLLRVLRQAGALSQRSEFTAYAQLADPRIMSNEVLGLLAEGVAAGYFPAGDEFYVEVKTIADARAPQDRRDLEQTVREGQAGAAMDAVVAGDVLYSLSDFARAETMYQQALEKGGDRDTALTRAGMAQVLQGNYAAAIETLAQVGGTRQPVANLWAAWAEEKMGS